MKKPVLAVLGLVLLLVLAGCGGSSKAEKPSLTKEEKKVADNIAKTFSEQSSGSLNAKEADCFSEAFVDKVGLKALKEAKLIDAEGEMNQATSTFTKDISGKFAEAFLDCVDYQKRQAEEIAKADTKVDATELAKCLDKAMPKSYIKKLIVASQSQASDAATLSQDATKKLSDCKTEATKATGSSSSPSSSPSTSPSSTPSE